MFFDDKAYGDDYDAVSRMCNLQKGDIFIDIGANTGQEIEYFASRDLTVDSYEPHPELFNFLKSKYSGYSNITLNNAAVYNSNCYKILYFKKPPKDNDDWFLGDGGATLVNRKKNIPGRHGAEVRCIDIVDVLNKILSWRGRPSEALAVDSNLRQDKLKILKIDVEGAEYHILKRLIETNMIGIPQFIFFEDHSHKMYYNAEFDQNEFDQNKKYVEMFVKNNDFKFYRW